MPVHREECGPYLIEASAVQLPDRTNWQPRLTMTRLPSGKALSKVQSFPGLRPVFATAKGATRYAADLGRQLVDAASPRLRV